MISVCLWTPWFGKQKNENLLARIVLYENLICYGYLNFSKCPQLREKDKTLPTTIRFMNNVFNFHAMLHIKWASHIPISYIIVQFCSTRSNAYSHWLQVKLNSKNSTKIILKWLFGLVLLLLYDKVALWFHKSQAEATVLPNYYLILR